MEQKSADIISTNETTEINDSYLWKLPSERYPLLEDIKNAKHGEMFESPTFKIGSFDCYLELHPNGCNDRTKGQIMLFICIKSMPTSISSLLSNFKLLLKETNTVVVKRAMFRQHRPHSNWVRGTLHSDKIKHLNELTFEVVMDIQRIIDVSGNDISKNPIDFRKEKLMKQMIFTEGRLEEAYEYLLSQCKVKNHIYFDPQGWLYEVGVIVYNNGNPQKAIEICLNAKSDGDELIVIGQAYQDMNETENAIKYYEQYMSEFPEHCTKIMNVPCALGVCYNKIGNINKAKEWFLKGTKISSKDDNSAWEQYANLVRYSEKNYEEALSVYLEHFDETNPKHYGDIASIYHQLGNKVKSKEYWVKGVMNHPKDIILNQAYANYLLAIGNPRRSLFYNWRIIEQNNNKERIDVLIKIMKALKILNKVDECIGVINNVISLIKNVYEMKLNKDDIVDSYTWALNKNKKEKIKLLTVFQFEILDCLQSIATGDKHIDLFRNVLDFIIYINEECFIEYNMLRIVEWLLYVKDTGQLQVMFDEWKDWSIKAIKTFGFIYYELKQYSKSIGILLRALDMKENEKDENALTGCYYGLCLNYLELNNNDMYNKYLALALQRELKFIKMDSWDKHFKFDEINGKYSITDPDIDIKFDFDAENDDNFETPHPSVIEQYKYLEIKTDEEDESDDENEDISEELKNNDTDPVVINYCHDIEWIIVNAWYEGAISTSAHSTKWNEMYLECLFSLQKYNEVIEYIKMFNLQNKLSNALLLEIGNYFYFKRGKIKTAFKYYNLIRGIESEKIKHQKARCHKRLHHNAKAIEYYKNVLSSDPFYTGCHTEFSDFLLFKLGDFENAQRSMFRGVCLDPADHDILDTFAAYLSNITVAKYDDALIIYTKIFNSGKKISFINAARNFHKLKQNKKAIDLTVHSVSINKADKKCS
eukprot:490505_1